MVYRPLAVDTSNQVGRFRLAPWTVYTPAWTSSGSAPSLGDGTVLGGYRREGTTLHCRGQLTVGSTSTVGSGDLRLSLPSGVTVIAAHHQPLAAFWFDSGSSLVARGIALAEPSTGYLTFQMSDTGLRSNTNGLATGDVIGWAGTIEIQP